MDKYKLHPVKVPWKISASDSISSFHWEDDSLEILLIADLFDSAGADKAGEHSDFFDYVSIVQLRLRFDTVLHIDYARPQQPAFGVDPQKYDIVAQVSSYDRPTFFQEWTDTGKCPDPQMYQVEPPDRKDASTINSSLMTHWILLSHDEIINITGKQFTWEAAAYIQPPNQTEH